MDSKGKSDCSPTATRPALSCSPWRDATAKPGRRVWESISIPLPPAKSKPTRKFVFEAADLSCQGLRCETWLCGQGRTFESGHISSAIFNANQSCGTGPCSTMPWAERCIFLADESCWGLVLLAEGSFNLKLAALSGPRATDPLGMVRPICLLSFACPGHDKELGWVGLRRLF